MARPRVTTSFQSPGKIGLNANNEQEGWCNLEQVLIEWHVNKKESTSYKSGPVMRIYAKSLVKVLWYLGLC